MVRKGQKPDLLIEKGDEVVVGKPPREIDKAARSSGKRAASRRLEEPGLGSVVGGSLFCRCDYLNIKGGDDQHLMQWGYRWTSLPRRFSGREIGRSKKREAQQTPAAIVTENKETDGGNPWESGR